MGGFLSLSWSPFPDAPASASPRQMVDPASASPHQMVDPASASPRQISSTPSPVLLSDNLRKILGPNPHLSDNKLLRSWEYAFLMMSYCIACTLFGVLAVTLLPDPNTLALIRGGEDDQTMENRLMEDVQNRLMEAQNKVDYVGYKKGYGAMEITHNMLGPFGPMDDTDGYNQGSEAMEAAQNTAGASGAMDDTDRFYQGFREQDDSGGQEASTHGKQDDMNNAALDIKGYDRYRTQDTGVAASDGSGKKKQSKGYNRYKDTTGGPPKNYYDSWAQFNNKQKTYPKSSPMNQGPENIPPSTHYQVIQGNGGSVEGSRQPLVPEESSYTRYSSRPR